MSPCLAIRKPHFGGKWRWLPHLLSLRQRHGFRPCGSGLERDSRVHWDPGEGFTCVSSQGDARTLLESLAECFGQTVSGAQAL